MSTLETGSGGALWWWQADDYCWKCTELLTYTCACAPSMHERWVVRMSSRDRAWCQFPNMVIMPLEKTARRPKGMPLFSFCFDFWKLTFFVGVASMSSFACGCRSVWRLEVHVGVVLHPASYSLRYSLSLNLKFSNLRRRAEQWALGNYLPPPPNARIIAVYHHTGSFYIDS